MRKEEPYYPLAFPGCARCFCCCLSTFNWSAGILLTRSDAEHPHSSSQKLNAERFHFRTNERTSKNALAATMISDMICCQFITRFSEYQQTCTIHDKSCYICKACHIHNLKRWPLPSVRLPAYDCNGGHTLHGQHIIHHQTNRGKR